ncbi:cupin domain-containing protein [Nocardioides renjunii]|uniref:cupin domain-containing protein n=1 Tax=Nocardioides renjunii TaxID=3095075 RepID=UPI002AFEF041|nr:cupin domain-containing protein [Nocardioides sp. S-34]WQQ20456.1 cupin domain-containing protein [Nocardioides sp. S-34]
MDMLPVETPVVLNSGERLAMGTDEFVVLADCARTGGALFAGLVKMPPGGGPPVMHRHDPGEVYHVLEGEFAFYVGPPGGDIRRTVVSAGEVMSLAGGTPHTIRNESDAGAVAFVVHAPGAPMEGFTRAAAALAEDGDTTMAAVLDIAAEHGIELLGPPVE